MAKNGRKTKFKPIYCKKIIDFFNIPLTFTNSGGKQEASYLPTIEEFAHKIGVHTSTIAEWANAKTSSGKPKYPGFSESYIKAKGLQKSLWIKLSLKGQYNPYFAGLVGKNMFGWNDKQEVDVTSGGEKISGFNYIAPKDEKDYSNDQAND